MGKPKLSSEVFTSERPQMKNRVNKPARRQERKLCSTSMLIRSQEERQARICRNIKQQIRTLMTQASREDNHKRLQSALNIPSEQEIVPSAFDIPSIENMVSLTELRSIKEQSLDSGSLNSFNQCLSYRVLESEPQLMLTYMVLVQKALLSLGVNLSAKQNEKVIKGVWNLVVKFWKDIEEDNQYKYLSEKIEWGLFELLNFELGVTPRERVLMEARMNSAMNEMAGCCDFK